jgi:uncharacterized membrane protein
LVIKTQSLKGVNSIPLGGIGLLPLYQGNKMKIHIISAVLSILVAIILFYVVYMPAVQMNQNSTTHMLNELNKVENINRNKD